MEANRKVGAVMYICVMGNDIGCHDGDRVVVLSTTFLLHSEDSFFFNLKT
jgi:hypothetical protein